MPSSYSHSSMLCPTQVVDLQVIESSYMEEPPLWTSAFSGFEAGFELVLELTKAAKVVRCCGDLALTRWISATYVLYLPQLLGYNLFFCIQVSRTGRPCKLKRPRYIHVAHSDSESIMTCESHTRLSGAFRSCTCSSGTGLTQLVFSSRFDKHVLLQPRSLEVAMLFYGCACKA